MAQPIGTPESFEEMVFPSKGIDLSTELSRQIPGTTPLGKNVRYNEPLTLRARGGSRSGLSKYIADQTLTAGHGKIQHLNIIVDPTTDALLTDDNTDSNAVTDPSTNNLSQRNPPPARKVRSGGSARQPNRNKKTNKKKTIAFVQSAIGQAGVTTGQQTIAMSSPVTQGDLLVAVLYCGQPLNANTPIVTTLGVTDTLGNTYTQVGSYVTATREITNFPVFGTNSFGQGSLSIWYCLSNGSGANSLLWTPNGSLFEADGSFLEYSGVASSLPVDNTATISEATTSSAMSTGNIAVTGVVGGTKEVLIGAMAIYDGNNFFSPDGVFASRFFGGESNGLVSLGDLMSTSGAPYTGTATLIGNPPFVYCGIGVSFKPASA